MSVSLGAGVVGPASSNGAGGSGRYSTSALPSGSSPAAAQKPPGPPPAAPQKPPVHCQPSAAFRHDPGTQARPGGAFRQKPLTHKKSFLSSSHCQYPGVHWTLSPSGFWSGGSSSIGLGGSFGITGVGLGSRSL